MINWYISKDQDLMNFSYFLWKKQNKNNIKNIECENINDINKILSLCLVVDIFDNNNDIVLLNLNSTKIIDDIDQEILNKLISNNKNINIFLYNKECRIKNTLIMNNNNCSFNYTQTFNLDETLKLLENDYKINFKDNNVKELFLGSANKNPNIFLHEIEKLSIYSINNVVDEETINNSLLGNESLIFEICNFLIKKEWKKLIQHLEQLINKNDYSEILNIIIKKIVDIKLCLYAKENNVNNEYIAKITKQPLFIFSKYTLPILQKCSLVDINHFLQELYNVDYNIKVNGYNPYLSIKYTLLTYANK